MRNMTRPFVLSLATLAFHQAGNAQIIDDPKIGVYYQDIGPWKLTQDPFAVNYMYMQTVPGLGNDKILGIESIIYPDNSQEAFNLTRQPGYTKTQHGRPRGGGYTELYRFDPAGGATNAALVNLDRSPCPRSGEGNCSGNEVDNFFAAGFPMVSTRTFSGTSANRGRVKVDYVCASNCPAPATKTMWVKLGAWNMNTLTSKSLLLSGVSAANVVDLDAVIHSDPGSGPQVDNFEHMALKNRMDANFNPLVPYIRSRGGILWYGRGCTGAECQGTDASQVRLRMYAGHRDVSSEFADIKTSYRGGMHARSHGDVPAPIPYTDGTINRGWARIDYIGTASAVSQPYFIRTKAFPIGAWNMVGTHQAAISYAGSGLVPNRITGMSTVIRSDRDECGPGCLPGWTYTNFHRPHIGSGSTTSNGHSGGVTYIDGQSGVIRVALSTINGDPTSTYYSNSTDYDATTYSGQPYNRGYVRVDYLAAECADGTGQLTRGIIGSFSANGDDCHGQSGTGTAANYVVQTKGPSISTSTGAFYYAYKSFSNGTQYTGTARVMELENSGTSAKAGVMLRLTTSSTSYHASVVVTGNSVQFIRKAINGADITTVNNVTAPVWVRVVKSYDTYRGYYSTNGSTWIRIGPDANITTTGPFLAGLAASGNGLTTSGFTGVSL